MVMMMMMIITAGITTNHDVRERGSKCLSLQKFL